MKIYVWSGFSKRQNSTKQPTGGTEINVKLKDNCSIESPTFILSTPVPDYNYCQAFGHYYYVTDIVNINAGLCEMSCTEDYMATYKTDIGNTSAYILYDTASNTEIPDRRIPVKTSPSIDAHSATFRDDVSSSGSYIVSLTGEKKTGSFVVPRSTLDYLIPDITTVFDSFIQGTDPFDAIVGSIKQLVGSGQISQNVRDVRWVPFTVTGETLVTPLEVGMYDVYNSNGVGLGGHRIETRLSHDEKNITIPWLFSDWRNSDDYSQVLLYIPYVGLLSYPASSLRGRTQLTVQSSLDRYTGDLAIMVTAGSTLLGTYGASTGVTIAIGSSGIGGNNVANAIIAGASALASESVAGVASAILTGCQPISQSIGGISSGAGAGLPHTLYCAVIGHDTVVSPSSVSSVMGTPTFAVKTINTLSGYVQCQGASVQCAGRAGSREMINSMLNSGFFYE